MARTTKQLSGGGKDKFFRGLVGRIDGVPAAAAAAITAELIEQVTDVRVRRETWQTLAHVTVPPEMPGEQPAARKKPRQAINAPSPMAIEPVAEPSSAQLPGPSLATSVAAEPAFDPFAFSAVAIFTRKGKPALATALEAIASVANLHQLASAQHLAVDQALDDPVSLRAAIMAGTERRIAERKAAAS